MMPNPKPFDDYVEIQCASPAPRSVHFQRNRYSVPTDHAHRVISLRIYPDALQFIADGEEIARYARSFRASPDLLRLPALHRPDRPQARRAAKRRPFAEMPDPLLRLQKHLLKHLGGDRIMADVLAAIPVHGLEAVLVAAELALESGRPSGEHVQNVLARLKTGGDTIRIETPISLKRAEGQYPSLRPSAQR